MPKAVVLMPVYNTKMDFLEDAFRSFMEQDYKNKELVIYDDGSNLETKLVLESFVKDGAGMVKLITGKKNMGIAHARNKLLEYVKSYESDDTIIFHLDSDDRYSPTTISSAIKKMVETNSDMCFLPYDYFFNDGKSETPDLTASKAKQMEVCQSFFSTPRSIADGDDPLSLIQKMSGCGWMKVTRADLYKKNPFVAEYRDDHKVKYEDLTTMFTIFLAQKITAINTVSYYMRKNGNSITDGRTYKDVEDYCLRIQELFDASKNLVEDKKTSYLST